MCFISVLGNNTSPSSLEHAVWVMLGCKKTSEIVAESIIPAKSIGIKSAALLSALVLNVNGL